MFVQTRSSLLKNPTPENFEEHAFRSKKDEKIKKTDTEGVKWIIKANKKEGRKLDMKKLRYEVIKFGTSGFDGQKKEESKVALAVALGAKMPKKKCRNYAELLAERKVITKTKYTMSDTNRAKQFPVTVMSKKKRDFKKRDGKLLQRYGTAKES